MDIPSKIVVLIVAFLLTAGCSGSEEDDPDGIGDCLGFSSPEIHVFVRNSFDDAVLENALVRIDSYNAEMDLTDYAILVESEDNNEGTTAGAYHSFLALNSAEYSINLVVIADSFHSAVVKDIAFSLDTRCGASNSVVYEVHLCPIDSACL